MGSLTDALPDELMRPTRKLEVLAWIAATRLPMRFRRTLLQHWAEATGATVTPEDYKKLWVGDPIRKPGSVG